MTNVRKVDLYIGSGLGLWAIERVNPSDVGQVFTVDRDIAAVAAKRGMNVRTENANEVSFNAAPFGLSVHYPRIIRPELIQRYVGLYNLHPGYLPWGRGFYPVFWALWEKTPAGATLHEITEGLDEGPVVAQIRVEYDDADTGGSLHDRVRVAEKRLFDEFWPVLVEGRQLSSSSESPAAGSVHLKKEFLELKQRANWETMSTHDFLRLARCLTFPGYSGLEVTLGNRRFALKLETIEEKPNP